MIRKRQYPLKLAAILCAALLLMGCTATESGLATGQKKQQSKDSVSEVKAEEVLRYQVDPETFALTVEREGKEVPVSLPGQKRSVANLIQNENGSSWEYPEEDMLVSIKPEEGYLHVSITSKSEEDKEFVWPNVSAETYYLPLGEGKRIPAADPAWNNYLSEKEVSVLEELSMPFWISAQEDEGVLFIMENPYRSRMVFSGGDALGFSLTHKYPQIDPEKQNSFRIYVTENNPVLSAKKYRDYVKEQGRFVTLEEKAEKNTDIRKLYGAPHIYLWGDHLISKEDIRWPAFRESMDSEIMRYLGEYTEHTDSGQEAAEAMEAIRGQDYVDEYQKNTICRFLSEVLKQPDFYRSDLFPKQKDQESSSLYEWMQINRQALAEALPQVFEPAENWMEKETVGVIKGLKQAGIQNAWIGLNNWEQAFARPDMAAEAVKQGYLFAAYDSYHSIHEPGKEQWNTAAFPDTTLYEEATVLLQNGEKAAGFQNVGRKLNPVLSMPSVQQRMEEIKQTNIPFNSWFIDCDATGEVYDDYSPEHMTTQQEDIKARLERMALIRDEYGRVIGSEGGNDFAASTIAFAHGIELKTFSWMDEDMKSNKDSEYYIGKYYNPTGGVAEHFAKRIPVKQEYYSIFVDPRYDVPLYKLVYNDSVITGYHWDWSTFKIKDVVGERMLREVLYNVPPMYHLDSQEWERYRTDIAKHTNFWSEFSREAVLQEMTDFQDITGNGSVQMTRYGEEITVVANYNGEPYRYEEEEIPGYSLLLERNGKTTVYTPDISEDNR